MRILWDICERCGKFIPHEIDWLKGIWRPKGYVEGEVEKTLSPNQIVEILKEAYVRCRKYKDGVKTKDRWLQAEIYDVLSENWIRYGKPPTIHRLTQNRKMGNRERNPKGGQRSALRHPIRVQETWMERYKSNDRMVST